jgi:hypothetical protein
LLEIFQAEKDIPYWRGDDPTCDPNILQAKLGIDEQRHISYSVYPNPTRDILYLAGAESVAISIVDVLGREIYKSIYTDRLDVSDFPKGVYLIYFVEDKKMYRSKFIKE